MRFLDIYDWLRFVETCSFYQLKELVNEDFYLDEYIKDIEIKHIDQKLLLVIKEKLQNSIIEHIFWQKSLHYIHVESLNNSLLDYFISNNIAIHVLGHMQLSSNYLDTLANTVDEAVITLGKRYFIENEYSLKEFEDFVKKHNNNYWLWSTLLNLNDTNNIKNKILIRLLFLCTSFDELKNNYIEENKEKVLKKTKKIEIIENAYKKRNPIFLKAIAINPITPLYIINELVKIKEIKYANQIRSLALKNLNARK